MQNPDVNGTGYQEGPLFGWGYENIKQYVLDRDNHLCQLCKKKSKKYLRVHHIIWRDNGGSDRQDNLATVCTDCHDLIHTSPKDNAKLVDRLKGSHKKYQKTTMFNTIMPRFYEWLRDDVDVPLKRTYGYITKWRRKDKKIEKSHTNDAYFVALRAANTATPFKFLEEFPIDKARQERRHDRKLITRIEDRKYRLPEDNGKRGDVVAKNRNRRTGQTDKPGLKEIREQHGEAYVSRLKVGSAKKAKSSKFKGLNKGDIALYDGKVVFIRGFTGRGSAVYINDEKKPVPANKCKRIKRNCGIIWL